MPMTWGRSRCSSARITGLRTVQLWGSAVLAKRRLKDMIPRRWAWCSPDEADEAGSAVLDRGAVTAAASAALSPRRRVTRLWFGTKAPSVERPGESCEGKCDIALRDGREHGEMTEWRSVDMVLTIPKVAG
ncbi:hypothetical protein Scel_79630 [Streptomyces cellostaticus]|nr:hypothetical protein Scel_79630 [Streptomyces cellostaticus]